MTPIKTTYVDRPEVSETLVDTVQMTTFHENLLRMELCVTRLDEPHPLEPPKGRSYPVARLAFTPSAALQLHQNLSNLLAALEKQGVIQRVPIPPQVPVPPKH